MNISINKDKLFNLYCLYYLYKMWKYDHMDINARQIISKKKLDKIVKLCYKHPIYNGLFKAKGINDSNLCSKELCELPSLSKEMYREWMNNELANNSNIHQYKFTHTSGSTGIPTTNIFSVKEYAHHYMADFFCWVKGGYNPFLGKSLTRQPGDSAVGQGTIIQKLGLLRRNVFNTHWNRNQIISLINDYKPDFILANSSELLYIAQYIIENNLEIIPPQFFCPTGENIDGRTEAILKSVYGEGLINIYGGTEMADFAVKIPGDNKYEILEDLVSVCIRRDDGNITYEGEGSILVTPLFRKTFPLLNYELGDRVKIEIINGRKYITKIYGRKNDTFVWKNGEETIYKQLEEINCELKGIFQIRFIQNSIEMVTIQVVKDIRSKYPQSSLEEYLHDLYDKLFPPYVDVEIEWCKKFPPEANGKTRNMISLIK